MADNTDRFFNGGPRLAAAGAEADCCHAVHAAGENCVSLRDEQSPQIITRLRYGYALGRAVPRLQCSNKYAFLDRAGAMCAQQIIEIGPVLTTVCPRLGDEAANALAVPGLERPARQLSGRLVPCIVIKAGDHFALCGWGWQVSDAAEGNPSFAIRRHPDGQCRFRAFSEQQWRAVCPGRRTAAPLIGPRVSFVG